MRKIKVFISSVIEGYKDRRDAAEEATVELNRDGRFNFEAVRVDKFPAQDKSSQKACLDGVNESDIYLGIYGRSYGWKDSPVGLSPTHEEFREAKNKKPILVFVEDIPDEKREPEQREFFKEVEDYVDGRHRKKFKTVSDLKHEVYRALLDLMNAEFEQRLPDYSKSLLQKYERIIRPWGEDIEPLRINEIVQLELMEEQKDKKQKEEKSERINKTRTLSDALKEPKLLIVGDAGAGKSTLLQWITYTYAEQILRSQNLPVPVYLELKWYKDNFLELIATSFRKNKVICNEERVKDWIKKGSFLFLLDGFDELDDPVRCLKDINEVISFSKENRFVVTSRKIDIPKDIKDLEFKRVEVKHLSDSQIELFIEKYLGKEKGSTFWEELKKHNLLNEARNPLILWFMVLEIQGDKFLSINKGNLFKKVIENRFLRRWDEKVIPAKEDIQKYTDLKVKALSKLAFFMIKHGDSVKIEEDKAREIIDNLFREGRASYKDLRDEILRQLFLHNILVKHGSQVSFWHKSFRDYFAALELMDFFSKEPEGFMKHCVAKEWENPIIFLAGIMDDPSDFVGRLIQPFWQYFLKSRERVSFRLCLAAKCIGASGKVNPIIEQKVIDLLIKIIQTYKYGISRSGLSLKLLLFPVLFDVDNPIQALGETKSEKAALFLGEYLENCEDNEDEYFRQVAVKAIENMPLTLILKKRIQKSLLSTALHLTDQCSGTDAGEILAKNMSEEILSNLIQIVINKKEEIMVRQNAIYIIRGGYDFGSADLKHPEAIDPLIKIALEEECEDVRHTAASALCHYRGEDKEEKIVNPLIHALLENPDVNIRANAAYAFSYHFSHKVRKALIQALNDEDANVRGAAAHTLAYVRTETLEEENEAAGNLLRMFSDEDPNVREEAIWVYAHIRRNPTDEEVTQLINLLKDENVWVRGRAAEALGLLEVGNALDKLKQMVEDETLEYPWAYAIWAVLQMEPSFSKVIKEKLWESPYILQLYSDDFKERKNAVFVLRRIGTDKSLSYLKELKEDYTRRKGISEVLYAIWDIEERIKMVNV